ncbi:MAG: hypothetical protein JSW39_26760 [Desulfobacterales bacterium]|nr:MAG: hypothetical protein JSW39_26760 [Desulfobacterales bacterium]
MKTKLLFWGAILFFVLGWKTQDNLLYYFWAIHLFTLFVAFVIYRMEKKFQPAEKIESLPEVNASKAKSR